MRHSGALAIILLMAGCASMPGNGPAPKERNGEEFGVVSGTFRGRWWNHYERGRSYLDGGFYAEARSDFEIARSLRETDQRWARTYGLHFIPEYFPNRELGITAYHEGKLDEAQELLERSLREERSALAEHFLDLVRAGQAQAAGGDGEAPVIVADARAMAQEKAGAMQGVLRARVTDNTYVARVTINGEAYAFGASAREVAVAAPFALASGENSFEIAATDLLGNVARQTVTVERDYDGPAVALDAPAGGLLTGTVLDPAGVAALTAGGTPVALTAVDAAAARFSVAADAGELVATDTLGNETRVQRAVQGNKEAALAWARVAGAGDNAWLAGLKLAAADTAGDGIRLTNLAEGQRYLMDEIVVTIEAADAAGINAIELDGVPLPGVVAGATRQFLSRRIRLEAMGAHTVRAKLTDAAGKVLETAVNIERAPTDVERPEEKLRVALLGNLWEGAGPTLENETNFVAEELSAALFRAGRLDVVSRDALPRVLQEQELRTVLGSRDLDAGLRQLVPADVLAVGKVRRSGDTLEIVLQAVSSETSNILGYADVAGAVKSAEDLRALTRDLAVRFEQEFPRVTGTVVKLAGPERCFTTLSAADRVRAELPCVVYRLGEPIVHPQTGAVLGRPTEIVARGRLEEVQGQLSRLGLRAADGATVEVNDHVATR